MSLQNYNFTKTTIFPPVNYTPVMPRVCTVPSDHTPKMIENKEVRSVTFDASSNSFSNLASELTNSALLGQYIKEKQSTENTAYLLSLQETALGEVDPDYAIDNPAILAQVITQMDKSVDLINWNKFIALATDQGTAAVTLVNLLSDVVTILLNPSTAAFNQGEYSRTLIMPSSIAARLKSTLHAQTNMPLWQSFEEALNSLGISILEHVFEPVGGAYIFVMVIDDLLINFVGMPAFARGPKKLIGRLELQSQLNLGASTAGYAFNAIGTQKGLVVLKRTLTVS